MALPTTGGGDQGGAKPVRISCVCHATLTTAIAALIAAGSEVRGTFCVLSTGANRQVNSVSSGDLVQGRIQDWGYITSTTYWLVVDFYGFKDEAAAWHQAVRIGSFPYNSAPSLGGSISHYSATQVQADAAGCGNVIDINTTAGTVDVIM